MPSTTSVNTTTTAMTNSTPVFVVLTEQYYGGEHLIRVFKHSQEAQQYTNTIPDSLDVLVLDTFVSSVPDNNTLFVVVTEEYYGGGSDNVKVFTSKHDADTYADTVGSLHNLDTLVLTTTLS